MLVYFPFNWNSRRILGSANEVNGNYFVLYSFMKWVNKKEKNGKKRENPVKNIKFMFLFCNSLSMFVQYGWTTKIESDKGENVEIQAKGTRRGLRS